MTLTDLASHRLDSRIGLIRHELDAASARVSRVASEMFITNEHELKLPIQESGESIASSNEDLITRI